MKLSPAMAWARRDLKSHQQPEEGVLLWPPRARGGNTVMVTDFRKQKKNGSEIHTLLNTTWFILIQNIMLMSINKYRSPWVRDRSHRCMSWHCKSRENTQQKEKISQSDRRERKKEWGKAKEDEDNCCRAIQEVKHSYYLRS